MPDDAPVAGPGGVAPEPAGGGDVDAQQAVSGPATFLMVVGIIGILAGLYGIFNAITGAAKIEELRQAGNQIPAWVSVVYGTGGAIINCIAIIGSVVVTLGSMKMKNLQSHGFAMAASIIAMLPIASGCCLLGLPAGIWSLVVLTKPEIKDAFQ